MTMQNPQTCLSAELLRQLSHDELSPPELKDVEDHVSDCERCRQLLEVPQSDPQWQDEIVPILRTPLESPHVAGDHDERGTEGESLESILRLLGPTDDPHMLGRIGSYEVVGVIGRGGMGVVFKAYEGTLNRFVAIKMLLPHLAASGAARKRFAREGKAAAAVIDDNVMPIYSVAEWQGVPYLVTQYSRGATLEKRIRDQGPLELKEILRIGMQTARGLAAAHAQGLVHRDVKPSNILLDGTVERALLTDFGLARAVDDASITRTGIIAGTPQYMSPEQARGGSVDARSDLFGLGCVLYAMCTGRPPFRADSSYAILRMITDDDPRSIREINPDIPEWLCLLISRLMAKSPDARFGNAVEVAALLEQCLAHVQQPTSVPLPASLVPHAADRRSIFNSTRKRVLAMLGVFGVTLLGMVLWQATEAPDISGQWASDEWGTVVLEAKGAGEYEGTFTGSVKDKPVVSNEAPGGSPSTEPGVTFPMLGYGWIRAKDSVIENPISLRAGEVKYLRDGLAIADVNGDGQAEVFRQDGNGPAPVAMDFQDKASDAFKGIDTGPAVGSAPATSSVVRPRDSGTLNLKWSRVERRFNGTWGKGADRSGTMSLRLVDKEIRGGWTTDEGVQLESGTPLLGDLLWKRSVVTVPDSGTVLLGGPKHAIEATNTPRKIAPGEILVQVYGGRGIWKSPESRNRVGQMGLSLQAVKGVTYDICEDGEGDDFTKAVVHLPAHAGETDAESAKQEESLRTIRIAIDEALRAHKVPNVRWLDANGNQQDGPAAKGTGHETPLDRQNARAVVEAFLAAAIAGRIDEAASLVDESDLLAEDRAAFRNAMAAFFRQFNVQRLAMKSVYVNEPAKPLTALAISEAVKLAEQRPDGQRDGIFELTLTMSEDGWFVRDYFLCESAESADHTLKKYLEANPKAINVPPQTAREPAKSATGLAESPPNTTFAMPTRVRYFTAGNGKKIACSPDGKLIAVANGGKALPVAEGWKRTVELLDAETGRAAVSISLTTQEEDALLAATEGPRDFEVGALAFSPDGTLLAVGTTLGQVKLFESRTGKLVLSLDDEAARLADQKTPEKVKSLKRAMGSVRSLAFSAAGTLLATSGLSFEDAAPNWGGVDELGELATGRGRLKVWGVPSGVLRNDLVGHSHAHAVAFSADGAYLASVGSWQGGGGSDQDGSGVILWAPNTGIKLRTFPVNTNGGTWSVSFSPKGKLMAISSRTFDQDNDTSTSSISLLRTATGNLEWKQTVSGWGDPVAFSPDGKSVGVLCCGNSIRFFDTKTGTLKHNLGLADASQAARWHDFALLPQGRLAIAGVDNASQGTVEIWDFAGPKNKASAIEKTLDRQNARAVVEAFVAAALSGDGDMAKKLAEDLPADYISRFREILGDEKMTRLPIQSVYVNDLAKPTRALAISETVTYAQQPGSEKRLYMVLTLIMSSEGWSVFEVTHEDEVQDDRRKLKKFLEANPNAIGLPPQREAQAREARTNPLAGHWKVVKLADMPVEQLAGATAVIDEHRFKMHVPSQKGPHPDWRYSLGANGDIDLVDADDVKGESIARAKYSLQGNTLYLALNAKKGDHPRPESATGEAPQEGVQFIVLESDEEAQSSEAAKAPDAGRGTREGHPQASEQPALSKTLQQLQGKWHLTRQIADDGDETATPSLSIWEFKGDRIIVRDDGPGGALLIKVDESHSPVHVEMFIETDEESGLGLLKIEGDKLLLALGKRQKTPVPESRPEKLQWVSGVWYMELRRVKPGETVATLKPKAPVAAQIPNEAVNTSSNTSSGTMPEPTTSDPAHTIAGFVMEFRSGTPDVPVCLCDAATGLPVAKDTYKPIAWNKGPGGDPAKEMAIVVSDEKGNFRFDNVPDGKYRLIAQKWMGPYKGVFELHGAEIRLMGAIDEITVPRPADEQEAQVVPVPLGENTIQFNQDVGNNETFLFLSTAPPEFDPILGLQGLGSAFWKNLIGVNRMPLGKTTVIGAPNKPVYAFLFAADNSPGFAAITIPPPESGMVRLPAEPFVAGWSDGRKTPPPKLAELMEFMKKHELTTQQLLEIPEMSNANFQAYQARMQELTEDLSRVIELPEGESARVGDLLAADGYRKLQK